MIAILLATAVFVAPTSGAAQPGGSDANVGCARVVQVVAKARGVDTTEGNATFACLGDQVVFTVHADNGSAERVQSTVRYADQVTTREVSPDKSVVSVPLDATEVVCGEYEREIKSELETLIWGCLEYGEFDWDTGTRIWTREINYEWTMYPGWPSVQNKFRTIPVVGSPTWYGNFLTQKQNGILPPTALAYSAFANYGNQSTSGWVVGGITDDGSHAAGLSDTNIVDSQKGYNEYFDGTILTHRFTCDSELERCYYPNGEEAGL